MTTAYKTPAANLYPGTCTLCSLRVEAGAGYRFKVGTGWAVEHAPGTCPEPTALAPVETTEGGPDLASMIPAGRYAVEIDGKLGFFKIDKPEEGSWAGYVFVKQFASDETYPVKGARKEAVLELIAMDEQEAMLRYGKEIGKCGHCGRTLTDADSRAKGIGPVCAKGLGW